MTCHHNLEAYLTAYIDKTGIGEDPKGPAVLHRGPPHQTAHPHSPLAARCLPHDRASYRSLRYRNQNRQSQFPGDWNYGIFKECGDAREAASMANHASTRTTQLYDRRSDEVTLDEVERVGI
jgi:hypothetical protein